jgi:hypothetical protein
MDHIELAQIRCLQKFQCIGLVEFEWIPGHWFNINTNNIKSR